METANHLSSLNVYVNNTDHAIVIKKWVDGYKSEYTLPRRSTEIEFRYEYHTAAGQSLCFINGRHHIVDDSVSLAPVCLLVFADSLEIVFDSSKSYLLQKTDDLDINILTNILTEEENDDVYEYMRDEGFHRLRYSFSNKDYAHATVIDGG